MLNNHRWALEHIILGIFKFKFWATKFSIGKIQFAKTLGVVTKSLIPPTYSHDAIYGRPLIVMADGTGAFPNAS